MKVLRIVQRCPSQNGMVERFIKTLKVELLYRIPSIETHQIQVFCQRYMLYYNNIRPHQATKGVVPSDKGKKLKNIDELSTLRYIKTKHVFGLSTEFRLAA